MSRVSYAVLPNLGLEVFCLLNFLKVKSVSHSVVSDSAIPWTVVHQAPLSMGFWQESRSGLPFPSAGGLLDPGIEARSPALQADWLPSGPRGKPLFIFWPLVGGAGCCV